MQCSFDILLSIILSRSIHVVANSTISFFSCLSNSPFYIKNEDIHFIMIYEYIYILYPFIYQWTLSLLPYLDAAMNIAVHVSFQINVGFFSKREVIYFFYYYYFLNSYFSNKIFFYCTVL